MVFGITFKKLLLINFWFTTQVSSMSRDFLIAAVVVLLIVFLVGLTFAIRSRAATYSLNKRRVYGKWYRLLATFALVGELLVLFRQYNVYVLGARFWWLVLLAGSIWWGYWIVKYTERQGRLVEQVRSNETYSKYLPKKS